MIVGNNEREWINLMLSTGWSYEIKHDFVLGDYFVWRHPTSPTLSENDGRCNHRKIIRVCQSRMITPQEYYSNA